MTVRQRISGRERVIVEKTQSLCFAVRRCQRLCWACWVDSVFYKRCVAVVTAVDVGKQGTTVIVVAQVIQAVGKLAATAGRFWDA